MISTQATGYIAALIIALLIGCAPEAEPPAGREAQRPAETATAPPPAPPPAPEAPAAVRPVLETRTGPAAFISDRFHGKKTANGDVYDRGKLVAAHPSYPLGTVVRVTNLKEGGKAVEVRIIDRSASAKSAASPIIDVSYAAAESLGFAREGTARVRVDVLEWGR